MRLRPNLCVVDKLTGGLGPWSEGPWGRPAVPGDSSQVPRACGFDHLTRVTHALIPGLTGSTSYHRVINMSQGLLPDSDGLRGRPALLATCAYVQEPAGLTSSHGPLGPGTEGLRVLPALPHVSCSRPIACGVKYLYRVTRTCATAQLALVSELSRETSACFRGPAVSSSYHRLLGPGSEGPRD